MQYKATIRYQNRELEIKVTNKTLENRFSLPEFLKAVRVSRNHDIFQTHLFTDYPPQDCQDFEEGKKDITQKYLNCFATAYKIPKKIVKLGYIPSQKTKSELAERLTALRLNANIPQFAMASDLDIARSTYASYETGRNEPDIHTLIKIAEYYNVSLDYLVGRY